MPHYATILTVPAPPEQVFDRLSRFDRAAEWDPSVREGELLTPGPVRLGSRFRIVVDVLGRGVPLVYEVVELTPGRRISFHAETAGVVSHDVLSFVPGADGTVLVYDARLDLKGPSRLLSPLVALAFRRIGDRAAAGLRLWLDAATVVR
jgi:hypothetical protein